MSTIIGEGGDSQYYKINVENVNEIDVDWLASELNIHAFEFNVLKSIFGIILNKERGNRHGGTNINRDIEKIIHYANLIKDR